MSLDRSSLRRGASELVLIFVGITLALAFENWNAERVERREETSLLVELHGDLLETRSDLWNDIASTESRLVRTETVMEWVNGQRELDGAVRFGLGGLGPGATLFPNRSAYEALRTRGLDLIRNDSVRREVSGFYELDLRRIDNTERWSRRLSETRIQPFLESRVRYVGSPGPQAQRTQIGAITMASSDSLMPLEPERLRADPAFRLLLRGAYSIHSTTLQGYQRADRRLERLLGLLEREVGVDRLPPPPPRDRFWESLGELCGQAFEGRVVESVPPDSAMEAAPLVMHVRSCGPQEIRIPFHVGDDRSRTWVLTRGNGLLELRHEHVHEDGTPDPVTRYGGYAAEDGTATVHAFPADGVTADLVPAAATNVWTLEIVPGDRFVYALHREGEERRFRAEFDLARPVETPPDPW